MNNTEKIATDTSTRLRLPRSYLIMLALPLLLTFIAASSSPLLIVPIFLINWIVTVYLLWSGSKVKPEELFSGKNQFGLLELALAFSLLQILAVFPLVLGRLLIASVTGLWISAVISTATFASIATISSLLLPTPTGSIINRNWLLAAVTTIAASFLLDLFFLFEYELVIVVSLSAGLISLNSCYRLFLKCYGGGPLRKHKNRLWLLQFAAWAALFVTTMNYSALGNFNFFAGKAGYTLEQSARAGTNSLGFRNREFLPTPPPGTIRIATLGDSFTYGWLVPPQNAYPGVLQQLFDTRTGSANHYQVINGGVPSYNLERMTARLTESVLPLGPQHIILLTAGNDLQLLYGGQFEQKLVEFIRLVRQSGAQVTLCSYPVGPKRSPKRRELLLRINEIIEQTARQNNTGFVDLFAALQGDDNNFLPDGHPSIRGYRLMAQAVFDQRFASYVAPVR
jgi:lysophospholipase L1-like esterase